jgi:hypothetical protein
MGGILTNSPQRHGDTEKRQKLFTAETQRAQRKGKSKGKSKTITAQREERERWAGAG